MSKLLSARISPPFIWGGGFLDLHLKKAMLPPFVNSIPQGMKSIRREWKCYSQKNSRGGFNNLFQRIFFIEDRCCSFLLHIYSIHSFPYPPPPPSNYSVKKKQRVRGLGCRFGGEDS
ncbi:hypothetical protein CEXT_181871 [Caerostris extrusa]|uniref:Uncharacterized protein n=1 Tax=Caerostris extrusa TaxID=172846 RepID=A0AAV4QLA3_CAEEX|nr:hypothetical protein CEXT_181871 [Caerostris extrusa]